MDLTLMSEEKRRIIEWLNTAIKECKAEKESLIEGVSRLEKIISEKQAIVNELMGIPLKE